MARCRLCARRDATEISAAIASGAPLARIAREYGASRSAMTRHLGHMTPAQREAREAAQVSPTQRATWSTATVRPVERVRLESATDLFDIIRASLATARRICTAAETAGDFLIALQAVRAIGADVQTAAKLMGVVMPDVLALVNVQPPVTYRAGESPLDMLRARLDAMAVRPDPRGAAAVAAQAAPSVPEVFNAPLAQESEAERIQRSATRFLTLRY